MSGGLAGAGRGLSTAAAQGVVGTRTGRGGDATACGALGVATARPTASSRAVQRGVILIAVIVVIVSPGVLPSYFFLSAQVQWKIRHIVERGCRASRPCTSVSSRPAVTLGLAVEVASSVHHRAVAARTAQTRP